MEEISQQRKHGKLTVSVLYMLDFRSGPGRALAGLLCCVYEKYTSQALLYPSRCICKCITVELQLDGQRIQTLI